MNQLLKQVTVFLLLYVCATTASAQDSRTTSSSSLLYQSVNKPAVIAEDHETLEKTIPSATIRRTKPTRVGAARKIKPVADNDEVRVFVDNRNLLSKAVLSTANNNPSATADYCTSPSVLAQGCCNYWINNNITNKEELYGPPDEVFDNETDARNYYLSLKPRTPLYIPYSDSKVKPGNVWYYSNGNGHGSVDYSKESSAYGPGIDPTFNIHSSGNGKVVAKGWKDLFGNYLIIEHVAPNGTVYRSGYFHLRDGFDHDLLKAKATKVTSGKASSRDSLYVLYANKPNPSQLQWGTNAQKIKVNVGNTVYAGQHVAFAGNTGYGGAGWGLDANGNPTNPNTANNHLHYMLWIKSPDASAEISWLEIDPYGLYALINDSNKDCLQAGVNNGFKRFFAAHYPSFHNVPLEFVTGEFGYFPGTGMSLQTLSVHKKGNNYYASGSFQYGLPSQWYCRINMNSEQYQQYFNEYSGKGYTPRQISVCKSNSGDPLFTVIWRKLAAGEGTASYHNMDDAAWKAAWKKHVDTEKKSCTEHVKYEWNGKTMHAAVFSNINKGFYVYHGMTKVELQTKFDDMSKAGFMPSNLEADEIGNSTTFSGVWVPANGKAFVALAELSPGAYQNKFTEMNGKGYKLSRVMGYDNSEKFVAVWTK
ncbi:MAG: hypothetical protein KA968_03245 [Chitinophagaceae bacterium]|nr:hypothetical protein [Chitinophagaceae bacterium]MBP7108749.1 hypothetical protein [Chitinophagaceae bacterium]MBP7314207.1 hypothetical protein [Chitinophagaceae bacterium]HQX95626.1 hypothetical protein [Chitinophagaceae bacterium]HQZ49580.1 hypothetical protein [Chitinophagaceae bacterium]